MNNEAGSNPNDATNLSDNKDKGRNMVRPLICGFGTLLLILLLLFAVRWWTHGRFIESTDNAYLRADTVRVSSRVPGYVKEVFVKDNQAVAAGQPLLRVDTSNYEATLTQNEGQAAAARYDGLAAESQIGQQGAAIEQARSRLALAKVTEAFAREESARYKRLGAQGAETQERSVQARQRHNEALGEVDASKAELRKAQAQLAILEAQRARTRQQEVSANAVVRSSRLNLGDTIIRAASAGRVGNKTVQVGLFIQPGQGLMSIVPVNEVYLVANFKETQLAHMRVGQHAEVEIDAYGGEPIDAQIESFAPGTSAQFALLPPENSTGNFVKIVQRIPVKFRLMPRRDGPLPLLPGLSATVSVDTSPGRHKP